MQIHELLSVNQVRVRLPGADKWEAVDAIIDLLADHPSVVDIDEVRRVVRSREEEMSTGVGKALAIPHGKTTAVTENVAALALTEVPVDFRSIDDQPVRLVFLLVGVPDAKSQHVKILSRVSRLMNRDAIRERMLAATTDAELYEAVVQGEASLADS